jgi:HEAT repeat protein
VPVLGIIVLIGGAAGMRTYRGATQAAERERQERAERARQEDEAAAAQRAVADQARSEAQGKRVRRAWDTVRTSEHPTILCDAALLLRRRGLREAIPDLEVLLHNPRFTSVQGCAAAALLDLGEIDTVLPAYVEWAGSADSERRWMAVDGFGDVGPRAAAVALPFLAEALRSPYWDRRYVTVDALSKLGPAARPLLEEARNDPRKEVREHAARALARGTGQ